MQPKAHTYQTYNYPEIFSQYFFNEEDKATYSCPDYTLIFVFSGELIICNSNRETRVCKGGYIFLRKDINTLLKRQSYGEEFFSSVFMGFSHNFLYQFYRNMKKKNVCKNTGNFPVNIIELPCNPYLESIYISLLPYLHWNIKPMNQIIEIKLMEAVYSLLMTDEKFHSCLFDFMDTDDKSQSELTTYNFIRNINSFSGYDTVHLVRKLQTECICIPNKNTNANIYMEAGYKNIVRFTQIIDNPYGFTAPN